jgi:hypothetical protein
LLVRRGLGHASFLWFGTKVLHWFGIFPNLSTAIETYLGMYAFLMVVGTALFELMEMVVRPDLASPCKEESPLLDFNKEE